MTPPEYKHSPLPERVAVLETILPTIQSALIHFGEKQNHLEASVNTVIVNLATLTQSVENTNVERSRWKDPMLYVAIVSVVVAITAVYIGKQ